MDLTSVDHVELYVDNAVQSADFFCRTFGFRVVAQGSSETGLQGLRSFVLQQGTARIVITSSLTADGPVAEHVRRHGDAVRDLALATPDAEGTFREAVRRGAKVVREPEVLEGHEGRVVRATIAGPGNLVHSFVQRDTRLGVFLPGLYVPLETAATDGAEPFSALDHVALALEAGSLERTVAFYRDVLGLQQTHEENVRTEYSGMNSKVLQNPNGRICLPMQEPVSGARRGQLDDFIQAHGGSGVQHLAFLTPDISTAMASLRKRGIEVLPSPPGYYDNLEARLGSLGTFTIEQLRQLNVLIDRDSWGYLVQAFTRSTHERRTLFFEVIQRQEARGFGGANIQALYEAKEREAIRAA